MFQEALIKFDKSVFLQKKMLQKWLDNVYSCIQDASPEINMYCR